MLVCLINVNTESHFGKHAYIILELYRVSLVSLSTRSFRNKSENKGPVCPLSPPVFLGTW